MCLLSNEFSSNRSDEAEECWISKSSRHVPVCCVVKWLIIRFHLSCLRPPSILVTIITLWWHIRRVSSPHVSKSLQTTHGDRSQTSLMYCRSIPKKVVLCIYRTQIRPSWHKDEAISRQWLHIARCQDIRYGFWLADCYSGCSRSSDRKKRVKKRSDFMEYKRSMAIIACFLLGAEIITLLLFVYFNVLRWFLRKKKRCQTIFLKLSLNIPYPELFQEIQLKSRSPVSQKIYNGPILPLLCLITCVILSVHVTFCGR